MRKFAVFCSIVMVVLTVVSCGKGRPKIVSPTEGQVMNLGGQTAAACLTIQLEQIDNDTTIEFRGLRSVQGLVQCTGYAGGGSCCPSQGVGGGMAMCSAQQPCEVTIVARRGDNADIVTFKVQR